MIVIDLLELIRRGHHAILLDFYQNISLVIKLA